MKTTFIQGGKKRTISNFEKVMNRVQAIVLISGLIFFVFVAIRFAVENINFKPVLSFLGDNWVYPAMVLLLVAYCSVKPSKSASELNAKDRYNKTDELDKDTKL